MLLSCNICGEEKYFCTLKGCRKGKLKHGHCNNILKNTIRCTQLNDISFNALKFNLCFDCYETLLK